ncbi:glycosyltransferase family 2 protein [Sphingomonas profundi]|uniref:glycosyltransferase family 2 protein n=1 Tax=Alterirhizorhabdus profundi TaxID=2681549 RepID=UPI0012E8D73E|nr:glycosyltransferase family 2 protein [Sphingomonas profundi]
MPTLSICIPTYNRSRCLAELLDSIIAQDLPEIEVVVSDDASPDDTVAVAERYRGRIARLTFLSQPVNIGLDRNFLAVVEAATGDYIWLMGDDDRLEPGGARRVLDALRRWPDVHGLTLGVIDYDVTMERPAGLRATPPTQRLTGVGQVFGELADLLGFMSALVVDREHWRRMAADPSARAFENYYIQVYLVGRIVGRDGGWGVVQEPCVGFRTGNDQFEVKFGWFQRLRIDVAAYDQLADALLADDPAAHAAMRHRVFDTHVMARINNAKTAPGRTPSVWRAAGYLFGPYGAMPRFWTRGLPTLFAPKWIIRHARSLYKRYGSRSGAARARAMTPGGLAVADRAGA